MDKKFQLKFNDTRKSEELQKSVEEILALPNIFNNKKKEAEVEMAMIEAELEKLSSQMLMELDLERSKKISDQRKELRYRLDDLKLIYETDINAIIHAQYIELKQKPFYAEAGKEHGKFTDMVEAEIERINAESLAAVTELETELAAHPYLKASKDIRERVIPLSRRR